MNPILVQRALEKVPNRPVLVNIISCRVRQLNFGIGAERRSLLADRGSLSAVDTALLEIIEDRLTFELPEFLPLRRPTQQGNRPKGWVRTQATDGENRANGAHSSSRLTVVQWQPDANCVNSIQRQSARLYVGAEAKVLAGASGGVVHPICGKLENSIPTNPQPL